MPKKAVKKADVPKTRKRRARGGGRGRAGGAGKKGSLVTNNINITQAGGSSSGGGGIPYGGGITNRPQYLNTTSLNQREKEADLDLTILSKKREQDLDVLKGSGLGHFTSHVPSSGQLFGSTTKMYETPRSTYYTPSRQPSRPPSPPSGIYNSAAAARDLNERHRIEHERMFRDHRPLTHFEMGLRPRDGDTISETGSAISHVAMKHVPETTLDFENDYAQMERDFLALSGHTIASPPAVKVADRIKQIEQSISKPKPFHDVENANPSVADKQQFKNETDHITQPALVAQAVRGAGGGGIKDEEPKKHKLTKDQRAKARHNLQHLATLQKDKAAANLQTASIQAGYDSMRYYPTAESWTASHFPADVVAKLRKENAAKSTDKTI